MKKFFILVFIVGFFVCSGQSQQNEIITGTGQAETYLPLLKDKKVALAVNHTALVNGQHLVDLLLEKEVTIETIFATEHGFRGEAAAGEIVKNGVDVKTGIPVISLYGKNKKPTTKQLQNIDVVVFDIQDVGCRFYTYISTLHLLIEACAENHKKLLVLDRPNPNGDYIAGPVLQADFQSFVGMDPIPVVHGCTVGELALMINEESWHLANIKCDLKVIPVKNYTHNSFYELPVKPSPNLPNYLSVRLYPSLCFFEATSVSVGRGTAFPFQVLGGLNPELGEFSFVPVSIQGVANNPVNKDKTCYGVDLRQLQKVPKFTLKYFLDFYRKYENEPDFLTRELWFNTLAGNDVLIQQIRNGLSEKEIADSWEKELEEYKLIRKKYLLYPDFE